MSRGLRVAVVGVTGAVGTEMVRQLEISPLPVAEFRPLASARSAGRQVQFRGQAYKVRELVSEALDGLDLAFFSAGGEVSRTFVPEAVRRGALVIDNSSAFRLEDGVPLVVPEVNFAAAREHRGLIANPNCSTIQMVVALKPIHERFGLRRITVATYQAVSGAGYRAQQSLYRELEAALRGEKIAPEVLPVASQPVKYPIALNVIPQIDVFVEEAYTREEMKMVLETQKIFADPHIEVGATCVRVPVGIGHSEVVYVETEEDLPSLEEIRAILRGGEGIVVLDDPAGAVYPTPRHVSGRREVFVGRIRKDLFRPNGLHLFVVADNLVKGAAGNAVQIAERLYAEGLLPQA